jgi:H+-translocating NAD(P) transhydrogenase subunit alpha
VHAPAGGIDKGTLLIGMANPFARKGDVEGWAAAGVSTIALEMIPRISRAQSMDVLSSQANLAGYRAVIEASAAFNRAFPMMMTAAGTIPPARALVLGAGVAGLQAIATARRLGAVVTAFDVRASVKEQIQSLGGTFLEVEGAENLEGSGGYAREASEAQQAAQRAAIANALKKTDIVICTAQIPGKAAPRLITEEGRANLKPGSVVIDMAAATGGNCAGSKPDEVVTLNGVTLIGHTNLPARIATDASALFARNIVALLGLMKKGDDFSIPLDDDIIKGCLLTHNGAVVHPSFAPKVAA